MFGRRLDNFLNYRSHDQESVEADQRFACFQDFENIVRRREPVSIFATTLMENEIVTCQAKILHN